MFAFFFFNEILTTGNLMRMRATSFVRSLARLYACIAHCANMRMFGMSCLRHSFTHTHTHTHTNYIFKHKLLQQQQKSTIHTPKSMLNEINLGIILWMCDFVIVFLFWVGFDGVISKAYITNTPITQFIVVCFSGLSKKDKINFFKREIMKKSNDNCTKSFEN